MDLSNHQVTWFLEKRLKTSKNSILGVRPQTFVAINPISMQHVIYHCKDLTETIQNMYILLRLISYNFSIKPIIAYFSSIKLPFLQHFCGYGKFWPFCFNFTPLYYIRGRFWQNSIFRHVKYVVVGLELVDLWNHQKKRFSGKTQILTEYMLQTW